MGSVEPYETKSGKRYRVRYRDPDRRSREKNGFTRKRDAEDYLASVTVAANRGEYVDPTAARSIIGELGPEWLANQRHLKPSAFRPVETAWRVHVSPTWSTRRVGDIRHSEVQAWVTRFGAGDGKPRSATVVLRAYGVLAAILDVAVRDRRIPANPARGVKLPRKAKKKRVYLTPIQVELLAQNAGEYSTFVNVLAYTGIRTGEAVGLRLSAVDLQRRRMLIEENAVRIGSDVIVGTPKSHESRSVPFPEFLAPHLEAACSGKAGDQLVFGAGDIFLARIQSGEGWFWNAVQACQRVDPTFPNITPHDLRHTAASLAISAGANPKLVQRMLGHASAAMTLDTYADLFPDDLETVSQRLDQVRTKSLVGFLWGMNGPDAEKAP
jgi:integrase